MGSFAWAGSSTVTKSVLSGGITDWTGRFGYLEARRDTPRHPSSTNGICIVGCQCRMSKPASCLPLQAFIDGIPCPGRGNFPIHDPCFGAGGHPDIANIVRLLVGHVEILNMVADGAFARPRRNWRLVEALDLRPGAVRTRLGSVASHLAPRTYRAGVFVQYRHRGSRLRQSHLTTRGFCALRRADTNKNTWKGGGRVGRRGYSEPGALPPASTARAPPNCNVTSSEFGTELLSTFELGAG